MPGATFYATFDHMTRTLIKDLANHIGQTVTISGSIAVRRDHGKLCFFEIRDRSGVVQAVVLPNHEAAKEAAVPLRQEWTVRATGIINARPEKMVKEGQNGTIEMEVTELTVLGSAAEIPFDTSADINVDTYLDYLPLTLRTPKAQAVFKIQATIITAFREALNTEDFTEIQAPKLIGEDAEGGANSFSLEYFGHTAHLAQSPQFYKQIMVGVFERVFAAGNVYRAEKHSTTRHLNEYTSLDIEMGYIESFADVMDCETRVLAHIMKRLGETCVEELKLWNATLPVVPDVIPRMKLRDAQKLITEKTGEDCTKEPDLEPAHERWLCEYAAKELGSDFIFITHFPMSKRPMYTHEDPTDPGYAAGFDLLFRGVEITTGGQRIHEYDTLVAAMKAKGLNPEQFAFYLQAFKYGMPPHGGFGMGLERVTAKLLGITNVKEATLFPRDINRIDGLLSKAGE